MRKLKLEELNRVSIEEFQSKEKPRVTIVLDNVRSGHNVGSVFRTCDAFAFEHIVLCGITPVPPHKEINKTAIGANLSVSWSYESEVLDAITQLKKNGYLVYGIEQTTNSVTLRNIEFPRDESIAIVFGNEVNGLSESILSLLDQVIEIDQYGTKHSLNISVCAGIVMWEVNKSIRGL